MTKQHVAIFFIIVVLIALPCKKDGAGLLVGVGEWKAGGEGAVTYGIFGKSCVPEVLSI